MLMQLIKTQINNPFLKKGFRQSELIGLQDIVKDHQPLIHLSKSANNNLMPHAS
jgi:hypothetical protein